MAVGTLQLYSTGLSPAEHALTGVGSIDSVRSAVLESITASADPALASRHPRRTMRRTLLQVVKRAERQNLKPQIQTIGPQNRHAPLELLTGAETGGKRVPFCCFDPMS